MNTLELVAKIADTNDLSQDTGKNDSRRVPERAHRRGRNRRGSSLPGFGKFKVKETPEREGRKSRQR